MKIALNAAIADCYHIGHDNLYKTMKETGRKVVVILHDDLSCYKIKRKIPVQTLRHRVRNVLLTGLVDEILTTDREDPAKAFLKVIEKYGSENIEYYRGDDLIDFPGKWMLESYKININYLPYTKGVSSSDIRKEICS